jgi:hypothetical protein
MSQLCTGLFHAGVLCVISAAISAADATSAEGQPEQAGAVAVTTDELDHVCAAWGCDCQFATDAYGLNVLGRLHGKKPRTPVEDDVNKWWSENNRCAGFEPTHGSVRAYNWSPLYKASGPMAARGRETLLVRPQATLGVGALLPQAWVGML